VESQAVLIYHHVMTNNEGKRGTSAFNPIDIHVGKRIRICRKLRAMSQSQLGEAIGISFQQLQKYESGANRIGASRLFAISQALNESVSYFFEEMPEEFAGPHRNIPEIPEIFTEEAATFAKAYYGIEDRNVRRALFELAKEKARGDE
jgi:transcriptional regulator with XRE-family HTH domain